MTKKSNLRSKCCAEDFHFDTSEGKMNPVCDRCNEHCGTYQAELEPVDEKTFTIFHPHKASFEESTSEQGWEENVRDKGHIISHIIDFRGVYDCGKCFDEDWNDHIVPIIAQTLKEDRERIGKDIEGLSKNLYRNEYDAGYDDAIDDVIKLVRNSK